MKRMIIVIAALLIGILGVVGLSYALSASTAVVLEGEATVKQPDGTVITVAEQSQIEACADEGISLVYHPATRTMFVPKPCNKLMTDGFE